MGGVTLVDTQGETLKHMAPLHWWIPKGPHHPAHVSEAAPRPKTGVIVAAQFAAVITNLHRVQVGRPGMSVGPLHSCSCPRWTPTKNLLEAQMVGHKCKILLTPIMLNAILVLKF